MNEAELVLWTNCRQGNDAACKELTLSYLYLVKKWARRISRIANWANQEDLIQDGVIGLINAVKKFDPNRGVAFERYASPYIRGAIFDSSELTRELARRQEEICRKVKRADVELAKMLQRNPTVTEVADKTGLSVDQIMNAIDAMGVAFAGELCDADEPSASGGVEPARQETVVVIQDAVSRLSEREQSIVSSYYWQDQSHGEIANRLGLSTHNVTKIRQRALYKLRELLSGTSEGKSDEDRRSGK